MFIKELIIDGFKSYANRVTISQWDREFNAITGLNGSGKSNILDAICFVLGITNLSCVRAQNLQDLIYKRGQAGITKASVTIVFDNSLLSASPVGFEAHPQISVTRQVIIGGKNKFFINGHVAQVQAVANLFHSVQLNINNPHFLIMQGRITKVLNMKSLEILAMIEEAAGTRMFEEKKEKAVKTIAKKDTKLAEIHSVISVDIAPKMDKLKAEKSDFLTFQKIEGELERLQRFIVAFEYWTHKRFISASNESLERHRVRMRELEGQKTACNSDIVQIEGELSELIKSKESELSSSGEYRQLQTSVVELEKELARRRAQLEVQQNSVSEESESLNSTHNQIIQQQQELESVKNQYEDSKSEADNLKRQVERAGDDLKKKEAFLQTLTTGISASEGQEYGYAEQIRDAKSKIASAKTELAQTKMRIEFLHQQMQTTKANAASDSSETEKLTAKKKKIEAQIVKLKETLADINYVEDNHVELDHRVDSLKAECARLQDELEIAVGQLSNIDFKYSTPSKNFDSGKVKGMVAKLIKIDPKNIDFSTALQVCAEGRLYFVVVDDNQTASELLKNGKLKRKYTIIPLNRIVTPNISSDRIARAKSLAPGKVEYALSLVGYEENVLAAMKFVFGSTLICQDAESAKKVAYDSAVKMRSITIDGDVYEPGATISGGSRNHSNNILTKLAQLQKLESAYNEAKKRYAHAKNELKAMEEKSAKHASTEHQLTQDQASLQQLLNSLSSSSSGLMSSSIDSMEKEVKTLEARVEELDQEIVAGRKATKTLEEDMKEFTQNKDGTIKKLQKEVSKTKKEFSVIQKSFKDKQAQFISLNEDLKRSQDQLAEISAKKVAQEEMIDRLLTEIQNTKTDIAPKEAKFNGLKRRFEELSSAFAQYDSDIANLETKKSSLKQKLADSELEMQKLSIDIEQHRKELEVKQTAVERLLSDHEWIADQSSTFGQPNSAYDFASKNIKECKKRLEHLRTDHDTLRKKINVKVMGMIDRVVAKEQSLSQMIKTVEKDKSKIQDTIGQLDEYKREALEDTWKKVNLDFGAIFGELLPGGNTAKLEPVNPDNISEGLEVKVCLGGVWKNSLTELSGGQRSLVALSLILSLLQFKPAPMYILDEIDAALDLSHTQNIGHLFRTRFKGSQFVVVSLKEGMFNNANVLFRAKFKDGSSTVERFAHGKSTAPNASKGRLSKVVSENTIKN